MPCFLPTPVSPSLSPQQDREPAGCRYGLGSRVPFVRELTIFLRAPRGRVLGRRCSPAGWGAFTPSPGPPGGFQTHRPGRPPWRSQASLPLTPSASL